MPEEETYLTVAEIAEILKLNQQTVRNVLFSTVFGVCPATAGLNGGAPTDRPRPPTSRKDDVRKKDKRAAAAAGGAAGTARSAPDGKPC
jgi:hypothetical protein